MARVLYCGTSLKATTLRWGKEHNTCIDRSYYFWSQCMIKLKALIFDLLQKETKYGSSMRPTVWHFILWFLVRFTTCPGSQFKTCSLLQVIRLYKCYNVTVRNIRIINSPLCHLKFDSSQGVKVKNITISSPKDSPNTDGIHLQNTRDVEIKHSDIGCGEDDKNASQCSHCNVDHFLLYLSRWWLRLNTNWML